MGNGYKKLFWKLNTALAEKHNKVYRLTQMNLYSEKLGRSVTRYTLAEKVNDGYKNVLGTWQYPEVVKFMGEMFMKLEHEKNAQDE